MFTVKDTHQRITGRAAGKDLSKVSLKKVRVFAASTDSVQDEQ